MCDITNVISENKVGYKVLAMKDDKFYSSFTGQEISVGKVPEINPYGAYRRLSDRWNSDVSFMSPIKWGFFRENFVGKTSAFLDIEHAKHLLIPLKDMSRDHSYEFVIVEITFSSITYEGIYVLHTNDRDFFCDCIAGDTIKSIKVVSDGINQ